MSLFSTVSKQTKKLYKPTISSYRKQLKALPGQFDPRRASLEQAKKNAFRSAGHNAQRRNLFYSGAPIKEQADYVGNTYTPALAQVGTDQATQTNTLLDALNAIILQQGQDIFERSDRLEANATSNKLSKEGLAVQERISRLR